MKSSKKTLVNLILNGQSLKELSREYGVSSSNLTSLEKNIYQYKYPK